MLNSAEHKISPANKSKITNNSNSFLLNKIEHEIFSANKYEDANYSYLFAEKIRTIKHDIEVKGTGS